jgi:serine/threonine protein kinase
MLSDHRHQWLMKRTITGVFHCLKPAIYHPSLLPENGFMHQLRSIPSFTQLIADRYQVIEVLKEDGCLQSVLAEDTQDARQNKCLIKQAIGGDHLTTAKLQKPKSLKSIKRQLSREAEILYKLSDSQGIPQILACFKENQNYYLVQEFIEGTALAEEFPIGKRDSKRWTERKCLEMLQEVLAILDPIHQHSAIHCNLNPHNLIRRSAGGGLVLINFGAVQPLRPQSDRRKLSLTVPIGPFGYLPPEQLTNYPQPNSDLYSLGLIAIQGLTGVHPGQLKVDAYTGEIRWQEELMGPVSEDLVKILNLMVLNQYQKRYQSVAEVQQAIASLLSPEKPSLILDVAESVPTLEVAGASETDSPSTDDRATETNPTENSLNSLAIAAETEKCLSETSLLKESTENQTDPLEENIPEKAIEEIDSSAQNTISPKRKNSSRLFLLIFAITSIIINSLIGCFGLIQLFQFLPSDLGFESFSRAQELYQSGDLSQAIALAKSVRWDSSAYQDAQSALEHWQVESEKAAAKFQTIETAFQESRWLDVLSLAAEVPAISYWQDRTAPLVSQAAVKVAPDAQKFLQEAYDKANQKDFLGAIRLLKQIPYQTPAYPTAQAKILEYEEKHQIKLETQAYQLLKQAYQRAEAKDFAGALTLLEKIPEGTPTHARIQEKISEYQAKRQIKGNALLQQAYNHAAQKNYQAAIQLLKQVPSETSAYQIAQGKINEYNLKLRYRITNRSRRQVSLLPNHQANFSPVIANGYSFNPGDYLQEVNI